MNEAVQRAILALGVDQLAVGWWVGLSMLAGALVGLLARESLLVVGEFARWRREVVRHACAVDAERLQEAVRAREREFAEVAAQIQAQPRPAAVHARPAPERAVHALRVPPPLPSAAERRPALRAAAPDSPARPAPAPRAPAAVDAAEEEELLTRVWRRGGVSPDDDTEPSRPLHSGVHELETKVMQLDLTALAASLRAEHVRA
jgi:hypothetical protein